MTPTARSTSYLHKHGWIVCRVEQRLYMPKAKFPITRDAFNFGDLLAASGINGISGIALVQVTSGSNHNARKRKIAANPEAAKWKAAGGVILLHSWSKKGPRGKAKRWTLREEIL